MKKLVFYICYLAALYLAFHLAIFALTANANKDYDPEAFQRRECQKTYYSFNI